MMSKIKHIAFMSLIFITLAIAAYSCGMKNMKGGMGIPDGFTEDYGKGKPGVEVILNKLEDQRKENWFVEIHFGLKPKHIEFDESIDFPGRVSSTLADELARANFKVIKGENKTDPVRPVISGKITRYAGVFKQIHTTEISLDITLTKGDEVLLQKTYLAIEERRTAREQGFSFNGEKIFDDMMKITWGKLMKQMMPELIEKINENT